MEQKGIILVGGGGHCKSVIEAVESTGRKIIGILDRPEEYGRQILGYEVIGGDNDISKFVNYAEFIITVGFIKDPTLRISLYNKVKQAGGKLATIVASTARVSRHATLGEGTIVLHHALVNADTKIGKNVILNSFSNIEHDSIVCDHCHISTGAMVNGNCTIGQNVFIGSHAVIANGVEIVEETIIGAGSVICKSITEKGVYIGNPAKQKVSTK